MPCRHYFDVELMPFYDSGRRVLCTIGMLVVLLGQMAGCGTSKSPVVYDPAEEQKVRFRVSDTQDARLNPERYRALFVEGSAPNDQLLEQHRKYSFYAKSAKIEGDTAEAEVIAQDPQSGDEMGTVQWTLKRVDGQWFIAEAPLP